MGSGLVKLVGVAIVAMGAVYLVKPALMKEVMNLVKKERKLYLLGVLNILIGIIFLMAAPDCTLPWLVVLVAILALVKGTVALFLGPEKIIPLLELWLKKPAKTLRAIAIMLLVVGVLMVYAA